MHFQTRYVTPDSFIMVCKLMAGYSNLINEEENLGDLLPNK